MLEIGFLDKDPKKEFYRSKNSFRRKIICCGKNFRISIKNNKIPLNSASQQPSRSRYNS